MWPSTCVGDVAVPHRKPGGNFRTLSLLIARNFTGLFRWPEKFLRRAVHPGAKFFRGQAVGQFGEAVEVEGFFGDADAELLRVDAR